jgi:hypothetical protein
MLRLATSVIFSKVDDELVLLDERSGKYWLCNSTATPMLERLQDGCSREELVEDMRAMFPEVDVRNDVSTFVAMALRVGLVVEQ